MLKFIKIGGLSLLMAVISSNSQAQTCSKVPDCVSLGFTMDATDCGTNRKLKCPFGDKYFCNYCEIKGYTEKSCQDGQTSEECDKDRGLKKCTGIACVSGYDTSLKSCSSSECLDSQTAAYRCTKCIPHRLSSMGSNETTDPEKALCIATKSVLTYEGVAVAICQKADTDACGNAVKRYVPSARNGSCLYGYMVFVGNVCSEIKHRANMLYGKKVADFCSERGVYGVYASNCTNGLE